MGSVASQDAFEKRYVYFFLLLGIEPQFLGHTAHSLATTLTMQKYMQILNAIHTSHFRISFSGESIVKPNFK
jgi:hypothetical protein